MASKKDVNCCPHCGLEIDAADVKAKEDAAEAVNKHIADHAKEKLAEHHKASKDGKKGLDASHVEQLKQHAKR